MKQKLTLKGIAAGMALLASVWTGTAEANEEFGMLAGIPAEAISQTEMKAVEGKFLTSLPILGSTGLLGSGKSGTLAKGKVNIPTGQRVKLNISLKPMGKHANSSLVQSLQLPIIGQLPVLSGLTNVVQVPDLGNILGGGGLPVVGQLPILSSVGGLTNLVQVANLSSILGGGGLPVVGQLPILSSLGGLTNLTQIVSPVSFLTGGGLPIVGQLPIVSSLGGLTNLAGGGLPIVGQLPIVSSLGGLTNLAGGGLPIVGQLPIVSSLPLLGR